MYREVLFHTCVLQHFVCGGGGYLMYMMIVAVVIPLQFLDRVRVKELYDFLKVYSRDTRVSFHRFG